MEEVEQEHAEKQVDYILNTYLGLGVPIETLKVTRIPGTRKDLEVLFPYETLAKRVASTFRLFALRSRTFAFTFGRSAGLERMRIDIKKTKRQELERARRKENMFYIVQQTQGHASHGHAGHSHAHRSSCDVHAQQGSNQPAYYHRGPSPRHTHIPRHHGHGHGQSHAHGHSRGPSAYSSQGHDQPWRYTQTMWR